MEEETGEDTIQAAHKTRQHQDLKNVQQNKLTAAVRKRKMSESEDETPPKNRNREPKGDVSKGEDSTETRTGGRTSNKTVDLKSLGGAMAKGKATTSSGAYNKKGKALKSRKQKKKKILMSDSDLDDCGDDVDHHKNDGSDGDIDNDDIDQDDKDKEDDESRDLSDDVQQYVKESNDVTCFNPTGNQAD